MALSSGDPFEPAQPGEAKPHSAPNSENAPASPKTRDRTDALLDTLHDLSGEHEPQNLLDLACSAARDLFGAAYVIVAVHGSGDASHHVSAAGLLGNAASLPWPETEGSWLAETARGSASRQARAIDQDPRSLGLPGHCPPLGNALACPLSTRSGGHGWLCVAASRADADFSAQDEALLTRLCQHAGRLLDHCEERAQLLEQAEQLRREAAEREQSSQAMLRMLQRLEALRTLDTEILAARSPRELVRVALEHLGHLVYYWGASVSMMDLSGHGAYVLAAVSADPDTRYDPGAYLTLDQYGQADLALLRKGMMVDVRDIAGMEALPSVIATLHRQGMQSYARIPMMVEGTLIGMLNLGSDQVAAFSREQLDFARGVANQLGIAVQQAGLRERIAQQAAEMEARVIERTQQLASANEDLEAFSYTVSHDLRAPLRAIDGFSRMFEQDYASSLDERGRHLLATIRGNAQRMSSLIDDLLRFAQLGRAHLSTMRVDMEGLAREAWTEIGAGETAGLEVGGLPDAQGDRALLKQVWLNLLSNAHKYSGKREEPRVQISATENDEHIVYQVRDNGAGFDMRFYEKLFGVFQRLHSHQEFPGTGVGLAMVQRVINRHGGRVWAESTLGEGACFYFQLPKAGPSAAPEARLS